MTETTLESPGTMRESYLVLLKQVLALGEAGRHDEDRNHQQGEHILALARALGKALKDAMAIMDEQAQTIDGQAREIAALRAKDGGNKRGKPPSLSPSNTYASPPASPPSTPKRRLAADGRCLRDRSPGAVDRAVSAAANVRVPPSACTPPLLKREKSALASSEKAEADAEILLTFIGTMSDEVRNDCLANAKVRLFNAGEIIFKEGTMGTAMYFLDSGHATVSVSGNVVSAVSSGVLLGEGSLLATVRLMITSGTGEEVRSRLLSTMGLTNLESFHVMRAVTVTADVPCRCLELNIKSFIQAFKGNLEEMGKTLRTFLDSSGNSACRLLITAREAREGVDALHVFKSQAVQSSFEEAAGESGLIEFLQLYTMQVGDVEIFESMSDMCRMQCFGSMTRVAFDDGDVIMKRGTLGDAIYFVQDGKATEEGRVTSEGRESFHEYRKGDFFGEKAFVATARKAFGIPSVSTAEWTNTTFVSKGCVCWRLDAKDFVRVISSNLTRTQEVLRMLSKKSEERLKGRKRLQFDALDSSSSSSTDDDMDRGETLWEATAEASPCTPSLNEMEEDLDFGALIQVLPGRLAFTVHRDEAETRMAILHDRETYYFSSELHETYEPYCDDFGPVDLATVFTFCNLLQDKLSDERLSGRLICYYAEKDIKLRTNAAFLIGAFLIQVEAFSPAEVMALLAAAGKYAFMPFRDATHVQPSTFNLSLLDCFKGLQRAWAARWFDLATFDVHKYNRLARPEGFDMHQICPKFVAFRGPNSRDKKGHRPRDYIDVFWQLGVTAVVRLNGVETYDAAEFEKGGIRVYNLEFEDCTAPPTSIVERFLEVVDQTQGVVAVHCLAGLGRTGTLISLWIMKNMGWTARECIAWLRIVRPGSVLGLQQHYLVDCERALARNLPLPEPAAVEKAYSRVRAARLAKQVERGMLRRSNNAAPSLGVLPKSERHGNTITEGERALIAQLEDSNAV